MSSASSNEDEQASWIAALEALAELWQALACPEEEKEAAISAACERLQRHLDQSLSNLFNPDPANAQSGETVLEGTSLAAWLEVLSRFGPLHQPQQHSLALSQAMERQGRAYSRCAELLQDSTRAGLARFQQRLTERCSATPKDGPKSLRELYEIWLEESEIAHERTLSSAEWCAAFTEFTHASAELISQYQQLLDSGLRALDLPNRADFIDTQRRVYELERQHRQMHRSTFAPSPPAPPPNDSCHPSEEGYQGTQECPQIHCNSPEIDRLRREVDELRAEIAQLRDGNPSHSGTK